MLTSAIYSHSDVRCLRSLVRALIAITTPGQGSPKKRSKSSRTILDSVLEKSCSELLKLHGQSQSQVSQQNVSTVLKQLISLFSECVVSIRESEADEGSDVLHIDADTLTDVRNTVIKLLEHSITSRQETTDDVAESGNAVLLAELGTRMILNTMVDILSVLDAKEPLEREPVDRFAANANNMLDLLISLLDTVKKNDIYSSYSALGSRDSASTQHDKFLIEGGIGLVIIDCIYSMTMMLSPRLEFIYANNEDNLIKDIILKLTKDQQELVMHTCEAVLATACDLCKVCL